MEAPTEFTAESVRDYILSKGGKVTNHELVKHFKPFLTDPVMKDTARAQFKEYVNMLANIKLEDNEKYLVLKKRYRQGLLAEVLSDVGSEHSYTASGGTPDPPDLGLPPPARAPPPYRPPPPAPYQAPGPAPYQPPAAYSPTYRSVAAPGAPSSLVSLGHERSPALDEYYHVPESRPADPQPLGLPPAPPQGEQLWGRAAPPPRRQAPLPQPPPPPPAEPPEWRPPPAVGLAADRPSSLVGLQVDRPPPPASLPVDRLPPAGLTADRSPLMADRSPLPSDRSPLPSDRSPVGPGGEPAPPVPPRRRSGGGKENQTPTDAAALSTEAEAARERESAAEEERQKKISVKEQTQKFNRIASESAVLQPKQLNKRRDRGDKTPLDDEDTSSTTTFEGINKDWILVSSSCKYMEIVRLLKDNPQLAKHKDFITGYTALHWAAKNGNLDIIKLIAGTHGVNVDSASHGGYTPLHIAMQYGHEDVFDLLVHTYGADPNVRDHSGRKPRQYMVREETTLSSEAFRSKYGAPLSPLLPPPSPAAVAGVRAGGARTGVSAFPLPVPAQMPPPLPAPPPPGYLKDPRRRRPQKGGIVLMGRPKRPARPASHVEASADPSGDQPAPPEAVVGHSSPLGRGSSALGRLRESFRVVGSGRRARQHVRASLPPEAETVYE